MAQQKSVFAKLQENFKNLYTCLQCANCKRKINLKAKCIECECYFCSECLYQSEKTRKCKACETQESIKQIKDRNKFIDELLDLILMFENDTGAIIVKDNFLNVETAENLERMFDKEKTSVFNQQKFIATSTPNVNNAKKVAFNSDITMIPQKDSQSIVKPQESVEKVSNNSSKKATNNNSSNSSNHSKRKADSITDKSDNSSKSKKAKVVVEQPAELVYDKANDNDAEIAKENEINNEMELEKKSTGTTTVADKQLNNNNINRKTNTLQAKEIDDNQENVNNSQMNKKINDLEELCRQTDDKNRQLEEKNRYLEEKLKLLEVKQDFEKNCMKLIKEQIDEQMNVQRKEYFDQLNVQKQQYYDQMKKELNNIINMKQIQEMVLASLTQIVKNTQTPITSSIEINEIGKIDFTIQPFQEIKKGMHDVEMQTDGRSVVENYVQTEKPKLVSQSSNTTVEQFKSASETHSQREIREVVNSVIEECNGHDEGNDKIINTTNNGNKSNNNNFSIQFDDSALKDSKESNAPNKINGDKEAIDSDELKKHVENDSIFDDSDDEVGASSPIYE